MSIKDHLEAARHIRQEALALERSAEAEEAQAIERIKAGETTGDRVSDFAFVHWGGDERVIEALHKLNSSLTGMQGQYILAVLHEKDWETTGHGGGFGPSIFEKLVRQDVFLAKLVEDRLLFSQDKPKFGFAAGSAHAFKSKRHLPTKVDGDVWFSGDDMLALPGIREHVGHRTSFSLFVGDVSFSAFIEKKTWLLYDFTPDDLCAMALLFQEPGELHPKLLGNYLMSAGSK